MLIALESRYKFLSAHIDMSTSIDALGYCLTMLKSTYWFHESSTPCSCVQRSSLSAKRISALFGRVGISMDVTIATGASTKPQSALSHM